MEDNTKFKGTADERLDWIKERINELADMMNENLLVREDPDDPDTDYTWLDYVDEKENVDTYETLDEINKFFLIVLGDRMPDYLD